VTFASAQHRDYYVDHDPAHNAFKLLVGPLLEKVVVTDFIDGVWN
jgi:Stress responsive A/B Barrel Domain